MSKDKIMPFVHDESGHLKTLFSISDLHEGISPLPRARVEFYEMDADDPYTLTVTWGVNGVTEISKKRPPVWKSDAWDQEIAN